MDEQYTPTMDWLEAGWIKARLPDGIGAPGAHAEFTRAIAAHDREVAEKAWREGNTATIAYYASRVGDDGLIDQHAAIGAGRIGNPYRQSIEGEQR